MTQLHGGKLKPVHSIDTGLSEGGMMAEVMGESVNGEAWDKTWKYHVQSWKYHVQLHENRTKTWEY